MIQITFAVLLAFHVFFLFYLRTPKPKKRISKQHLERLETKKYIKDLEKQVVDLTF
jgi:hypothetical protein